jgi:hypothetical protein
VFFLLVIQCLVMLIAIMSLFIGICLSFQHPYRQHVDGTNIWAIPGVVWSCCSFLQFFEYVVS